MTATFWCHKITPSSFDWNIKQQHHVNRSNPNMRISFKESTKLTITKVGSSIRSRSSAFSSADLLRLPPKCLPASSPTTSLLNKPSRRRIVCFEFHTPPAEEPNESIEANVGNLFRSRQTRLPLRFRSLSKIIVTPLSPSSSMVDVMSENTTPKMILDGRESPGLGPNKFHLKIRPEVLDATYVRSLRLNQSSSMNVELPFLPEARRMNSVMCFTPTPSYRGSRIFSPPVLKQSVDIDFHLFSPTMPRELLLPDDLWFFSHDSHIGTRWLSSRF
jgi:hypothetical protein